MTNILEQICRAMTKMAAEHMQFIVYISEILVSEDFLYDKNIKEILCNA